MWLLTRLPISGLETLSALNGEHWWPISLRIVIFRWDQVWLKEGLDMRIVTYACVPTSADKEGVMEMVRPAETLREIQV